MSPLPSRLAHLATEPHSRRRVLEGIAALAATLIATACGGAEKAATSSAAAQLPATATKPVATAAGASATSGTAAAGSPGATAPAPTLPANATPNALAAAPPPGATPTAGPVIGSTAALPSPGPAELAAFNKDPNMKVLDAVDWETPLAAQQPFLTDTKSFFVRAHYPFPTIKQEEWKLTIAGLVDKPVTLTYDQLTKMPAKKLTAWIECAGDGRGRFKPMASGGQWQVGAVSNAEWMGVSLNDVLAMASPKSGVADIVCSGAGNSQWARGLNWGKAKDPDTMLVWQMNGEPLRVEQGFPVRLIVPGYPGVAQVKWITTIDLIDKPYDGYFNTTLYTFITADGKNLGQLTTMPVKSIITSHAPNASVKSGMQTVSGKAWSGAGGGITKVEVSADGGKTWNGAKIVQQAGQWSWYAFEYAWDAKGGNAVLTSRATDAKGNVQPEIPPFNKNGYQYNGWWTVPVTVA
jgi:DMSO/TMAO reductase YedYZ molybdopterin-dependent catalytic subunit